MATVKSPLESDLENRLRLSRICGIGIFRLSESISALLVFFAGYSFVARLFGATGGGVEIPVFFGWRWSAVPESTTYGINPLRSGGHGTLRLDDVPSNVAAFDALLLLTVAIAVFMVLRQVRGLIEDVEYRGQLAECLSLRLRRMGWFVVMAGGAWMVRDAWASWWVSGNLQDPGVLDSVSFEMSVSVLGFVAFGAGLLLLFLGRFIAHVAASDFYDDAPTSGVGPEA